MVVRKVLALRGPNIWARVPVLEAWLDLEGLDEALPTRIPELANRLIGLLGIEAANGTAALVQSLERERSLSRLVALLMGELQSRTGAKVDYLDARPATPTALAKVLVQFQDEEVARESLAAAIGIVEAAAAGRTFNVAAVTARLRDLAKKVGFGPNTAPVVEAARARGIPVRRLNSESLIQLGYGVKQRRFQTAVTDRTSAIAEAISDDKDLTKSMLRAVGVPVPEGRPVKDAEDAWAEATDLGGAVVVKPRDADHGDGISLNLTTREQVLAAYEVARLVSENIMVERYAPGVHHRLLVVGDRVVAAARRDPAHVVGDGVHTVTQLIDVVNRDPRRGDAPTSPLRKVQIDDIGLSVLAEQGQAPESIPAAGSRIYVRRNSHMRDGGDNVDVTDIVHPEVAARALDAVRVIGLDLAGLDVIADDITRPLEDQGGVILEVNANPWLRQHLRPWNDPPRPIGEAIVASLFPDGETGLIPIIAVTGTSGKTTTTRLVAHLLAETGRLVGMSSTDGIYIAGRRIETGDCSGPQSARTVLLNPTVEVAVLETAQGGIIREGLAFDRCDVTVVTNLGQGDHLELRGIDTLEDLARVKRTAVEAVAPEGTACLKAEDPLVAGMAASCPGRILWFSQDPDHPLLVAQRASGGRSAFVRDAAIVFAEGADEEVLIRLDEVPLTHGGRVGFQVENVLAAASGVWALGLERHQIRSGLASFAGDPAQMPARFNVFETKGATVVVDFPHNAMALSALIDAVARFPHTRRVLVYAGCNRRDPDVIHQGELIGDGFDRIVLFQDKRNQDRKDGELNALLRQGLAGRSRVRDLVEVDTEREAIELTLRELQPGDLLVLGVEAIETSLAFVEQYFAADKPAQ